jgi:hypothetical protein
MVDDWREEAARPQVVFRDPAPGPIEYPGLPPSSGKPLQLEVGPFRCRSQAQICRW